MSKEDKKSGGCNCKAKQQTDAAVEFFKRYGAFEDKADDDGRIPMSFRLQKLFMYSVGILLVPFLFMYIVVALAYNYIRTGKSYINGNTGLLKIMKNQLNNG